MIQHKPRIRFKLVHKLIISYISIVFFISAAIISSINGLNSQNKIARDFAKNDIAIINSIHKLSESMQAQERNTGRYVILRRPEFKRIVEQRIQEFNENLHELGKTGHKLDLNPLNKSYKNFLTVVRQIFREQHENIQLLKETADDVTDAINDLYNNQQQLLKSKIEFADRKHSLTITMTILFAFTGLTLAIVVAAVLTYNLLSSIKKLKKATVRISEGDFDYDPQIPENDEIGELAKDFASMACRLKIFEQICLDANPLTRLPGNLAIERAISMRLTSELPFAVCYADLDNFKAYNDRYGYIKASEVIKMTGDIIHNAVKEYAGSDGFVGHIGGDDFVAVISAEEVKKVCETIIERFSSMIPKHYAQGDIDRGAIEGLDRYGVRRIFPIMTISIAVIICGKEGYNSAVEVAMAAAQLKDIVKNAAGSNYVINRYLNKESNAYKPPANKG